MRHSLVALLGITISLCAGIIGCTSTQTATTLTAPSSVKCQVQLTPSTANFSENGGTGSLTVNTTRDCSWSTNVSANWVTVTNPSGQGESTVSYSVAPNSVPQARSTFIAVGDQAVQLVEAAAPCRYALSSSTAQVGYGGGSLAVTLQTLTGCGWTTSSDSSWLIVTTGASGNGSTTIAFAVAANAGGVRVGHALIAGQIFSVTQDAAVNDPNHGSGGGNGNGNGNGNGGNDKGNDNGKGNGNGKGTKAARRDSQASRSNRSDQSRGNEGLRHSEVSGRVSGHSRVLEPARVAMVWRPTVRTTTNRRAPSTTTATLHTSAAADEEPPV